MVFGTTNENENSDTPPSCTHTRPANSVQGAPDGSPYAPDGSVPLGGYAALAGLYATATGLAALTLRRTGRPLPAGVPPWDLLVLGTATYKISRLVTKGKITSFLRAPFTRRQEATGGSEVADEPRRQGTLGQATGELLACPFCASTWAATSLMCGYVAAPHATRLVAAGLSAVVISDWLQYAWSFTQQQVDN
ncbi:DUF1360 domain-containing protein [Streptomyces sp. NPDC005551]|uniref:DUF1360 domain-containing protein n=1 Tax=Streptomyces sp. NPDC005551 TaxID=3364725 RepID=UPI0036C65B56